MFMLGVCKFVVSTMQQLRGVSRRRPCCHVTQEHVQLVNICLLMHSGAFRQLQLFVAGFRSTTQRCCDAADPPSFPAAQLDVQTERWL